MATVRGKWTVLVIATLLSQVSTLNLNLLESTISQHRDLIRDPEGLPYDTPTSKLWDEYDFVVVGAGTAGSVVTNRLTEVPKWKVLLLEAGRDELRATDVPVFAAHFQLTDYNWGYRAQPQKDACLAFKDQRCAWPRGKGMGGTSIINYMIYTRGHPRDYDGWEEMGNPGWGWKDVYKYFLKSENANRDLADSEFHSTGGYLDTAHLPYSTKLIDSFMEGGKESGFDTVEYNSGELLGFSRLQVTQRNGARCSASKAFLRPIRNRANLHVAKEAQATKILIDPATKRAWGVEFQRRTGRHVVRARKEVILSAGAIDTPKLLMLSGVGPRAHLESLNISVVHASPGVGNNLQEHVSMSGLTFLVNDTVALTEERLAKLEPFLQYVNEGRGPLTLAGGVEGLGYIRTKAADTPLDYPDIELIFASGSLNSDDGRVVRKGLGMTDEVYDAVFKPINSRDAWTVWPMVLKPNSRGWVRLKSNNPLAWPVMYGNYFDDPRDLESIVEGIKFSIKLSGTAAFQRYNSTLHDIPLPGCVQFEFNTDDYWRCAVRQVTTTLHHQCGTAKMGPKSDPDAVVDPELRVHGIKGLRVVDASIIPRIPAAHTNAVCFMIGEKASDMIKSSYGK
ncbi:glucose dehydrogenase [FAD, quinone]-like [Neocloeon triangulifer]|uniref:glucose dehydrogenase [FAD, quinone]-like n=1 Tax=Neocloeon triangulifer TaxID=2078957 RepID=UPI00286EBA67|nr:glucose dehydrogenase [FAD, quinone]-like [Neocloeon triangulifer]